MGELNVHNLLEYINKYKCTTFVETGTGKGFGLAYAMQFPFEKFYSIEIIELLYRDAKDFFKSIRNKDLSLLHTDSLTGMKEIMKMVPKKTSILFWLDAHFPGADFQIGSYDDEHPKNIKLPLMYEIELILSTRPHSKDVFIIDDLNIYEEGVYELGNSTMRSKLGYPSLNSLYHLVEKSHNVTKIYRHQGSLVLTPKGDE